MSISLSGEDPNSATGGDKHIHQLSFLKKFNCIQFLFEVFFNTIGTFSSIQLQSEPIFSFRYIILRGWFKYDPEFF